MTNFLANSKKRLRKRWQKLSKPKKVAVVVVGALVTLIVLLTLWGLVNVRAAKGVMNAALSAKQSLTFAQVEVANQNFDVARTNLQEAQEHLDDAQKGMLRFQVYRIIPYVSKQLNAVNDLLAAAQSLTSGLEELSILGEDVFAVLQTDSGDIAFSEISTEEKRAILQTMYESPADLQGVKTDIELAIYLIENIPQDGLLRQVKEVVEPIQQQLPALQLLLEQVIPATESLPAILGYPSQKTYLFLLQNNRELRPTGGFIGTYGVLKVENGEIQEFFTDDVYRLDIQGEGIVTEPSPGPIAQHTTTQHWYLRDSNWSPNFPTSALKAEEKYYEEGGTEQHFDGVIAITPTFIESLLRLTGPISTDGIEFNEENLFENLEYEVGAGFLTEGIPLSERKAIIGRLSGLLLDSLLGLEKSRLPDLWGTFVDNVEQKQIQVYVKDAVTQSLVQEQNWGGEMKAYDTDYLMFVDANLAALKTDDVIERNVSYNVFEEDGRYVAEATMEYNHTYPYFDQFHTRYRTYTRVYVPKGAQLLETEGFKTGDKTQGGRDTEPEVYEESYTHSNGETAEYTVFAGFTSIEPGETGSIRLKYVLPESVEEAINDDHYSVYIQKQGGTPAHGLNVSLDLQKRVQQVFPLDINAEISDNTVTITDQLDTDQHVEVEFK